MQKRFHSFSHRHCQVTHGWRISTAWINMKLSWFIRQKDQKPAIQLAYVHLRENSTINPSVNFATKHPITQLKTLSPEPLTGKDYTTEKTENTGCSLNQSPSIMCRLWQNSAAMAPYFVNKCKTTKWFESSDLLLLNGNGTQGSWVLQYLYLSNMTKWRTKHDFSETKLK